MKALFSPSDIEKIHRDIQSSPDGSGLVRTNTLRDYTPGTSRKERNAAVQKITLDAEASQISAELARRVHVLVAVMDSEADSLPMAAMAQAGCAFSWLADEPDLYTDVDLVQPQAG